MKRVALVGIIAGLILVGCGNRDEGSARQESEALSQVGAPVVQDVQNDESSQYEPEQAAADVQNDESSQYELEQAAADVQNDESSQYELEQAATDLFISWNPDVGPSECTMFRNAANVYGWDVARSQFIANVQAAYQLTSGGVTLSTDGANYMLDTVLGFC